MGCGGSKESSNDNFAGPGRVLGATPQRTSAPIPSTTPSQPPRQGTGQTLGSANTGDNPRQAAARAAEVSAGDVENPLPSTFVHLCALRGIHTCELPLELALRPHHRRISRR